MPFPTDRQRFGTTDELFARIKQTIAEQTWLSNGDSALLTFRIISTWFQEVLDSSTPRRSPVTPLPATALSNRHRPFATLRKVLRDSTIL